jgi:hypothetical protein
MVILRLSPGAGKRSPIKLELNLFAYLKLKRVGRGRGKEGENLYNALTICNRSQ